MNLIHFLGQSYDQLNPKQHQLFMKDFASRIWITYRRNFFISISNISFSSDTGWGCMYRCAQMIMAEALVRHFLKRDWRHPSKIKHDIYFYKYILSLFEDNYTSPKFKLVNFQDMVHPPPVTFCLKNMIVYNNNAIGKWIGSHQASYILQKCLFNDSLLNSQITMYIANQGVLYLDQILKQCQHLDVIKVIWKSLIILIPLRLGLHAINPHYYNHILSCLESKYSIGFIGGRPRSAYYFMGYMICSNIPLLYFLDPHRTQIYSSSESLLYHDSNMNLPNIPLSALDPCLTLGFYISDAKEFEDFWQWCENMKEIFQIVDASPECLHSKSDSGVLTAHSDDDLQNVDFNTIIEKEYEII
jgi:cysteine protease ATG4